LNAHEAGTGPVEDLARELRTGRRRSFKKRRPSYFAWGCFRDFGFWGAGVPLDDTPAFRHARTRAGLLAGGVSRTT
jgi:hypothetical protein